MSFTSTIHYVVLLISNKNLPLKKRVKEGSYVVTWTVCKRTHNQYETSCGFGPHPRECL